jgi:hypothetical protein
MGALPTRRQTAPVPQAAISAHFHQALDIHRNFFAKIALNRAFALDQSTKMIDFFLRQIPDLLSRVYLRPMKKR